jgi:hypothetical protein
MVGYIVFPSRAAALADFADPESRAGPNPSTPPSGFLSLPKPLRFRVNRDGTDTRLVARNVEVFVVTDPGSDSLALTKFAVHHLMQVERSTS